MTDRIEAMKTAGDIAAASVTIATILQWLPAIAAIFTIIWTLMRIYESVMGHPFHNSRIAKFLRGERDESAS